MEEPRIEFTWKWEPRDCWVGVYWTPIYGPWSGRFAGLDCYICLIPMLPIIVKWRTRYE